MFSNAILRIVSGKQLNKGKWKIRAVCIIQDFL